MTRPTCITRVCTRDSFGLDYNVNLGFREPPFLCTEGLRQHWDLENAQRLEIRLHNKRPTKDAHRFSFPARNETDGIVIKPLKGETSWSEVHHGSYMAFDVMLREYRNESGQYDGWMEVYILEE